MLYMDKRGEIKHGDTETYYDDRPGGDGCEVPEYSLVDSPQNPEAGDGCA